MYGKDFFDRANIQQICEFLRYGELVEMEQGDLEARYRIHENNLIQGLRQYRKDILEADWSGPSEASLLVQEEALYQEILTEISALETITFEAGFLAGCKLSHAL